MNCPRCKATLGEKGVYCPQCGLNLMNWFMKMEESPGEVDAALESPDTEGKSSSGSVSSEPEEKDGQDQDISQESGADFGDAAYADPYQNLYQDPYQSPYQAPYGDPYGGFGTDSYDDPYKNITGKSEEDEADADSSSETPDNPDHPDQNTSEEETANKEQNKKRNKKERTKQQGPENGKPSKSKESDSSGKSGDAQKAKESKGSQEGKDSRELKDKKEKPEQKPEQKTEQKEQKKTEPPKPSEEKKDSVPSKPKKEKKSKGGKFFILLLLAVCVGAGYWLGKGKPDSSGQTATTAQDIGQTSEAQTPESRQSEENTAPEVEPTAIPTPEPALTWQGEVTREAQESVMDAGTWLDRNHMASLMDASNARYGLYVMDLTNCTYYNIGEAETPLPASALIGIPIMFTIAEGVSVNTLSMDDLVCFTYTFVNGRGNLKANQNGQYFSLGEMLKEALLYSDNNALNSLIDFLTLDRINTTCHQYGFDSVDMQRKLMTENSSLENYISPKDAAMMLNAIYQDNFTEIDSFFLKNYFMLSPGDSANKGMYPACGNSNVFLNLNGITETRYNEVGLVVNGEEVFIMAAMTVDGKQETSAPCVTNEAKYILDNLKVGER